MASFQKRGKTWQYTISAKPKPIRKGGFRSKKEAQVAAADIEAKLGKGIYVNTKDIIFVEHFREWVNTYKIDVAKVTKERYEYTAKELESYFGMSSILSITKREYQKFLTKYAETHAKETVSKLHSHVRACVLDAIDDGLIANDFTRKAIITGEVPAKKEEEKYLNYFEAQRLLEEVIKRLDQGLTYYMILLGLTSGMRFAEMVGLTRKDFDFENNIININKEYGYSKKMESGFIPTKNKQSVRKIVMDHKTMRIFKQLFVSTPPNFMNLVFFSNTSEKYHVISNNTVNRTLKKLLTNMNITPISVHGLRHTHASILLYKRISIYYISERLGHTNTEITQSTYSHVIKELREEDEKAVTSMFEKLLV